MSRVLIVAQLDRFANGVKPRQMAAFLRGRGHEVVLLDTYHLSRACDGRPASLACRLPAVSPARLALYGVEALARLSRGSETLARRLTYHTYLTSSSLRRTILRRSLRLDDFDLLVCEHPLDAGVLALPTTASTLYDCPTPFADELLYEGRLTTRQHARLRRRETEVFESVDNLAFHWHSYGPYVIDHYQVSASNLVTLDFGCTAGAERASFRDPPRIAYLGSLSSRFIDLQLLSRLTRLYPHIDVFGGPPPDPALGLNYKGHTDSSVLKDYQLGLVTCSRDELRRRGFSAKHLDYLAHGLPTLVPAWRESAGELEGTFFYTEGSFLDAVSAMSDPDGWSSASDRAYEQAQSLAWEETLRPLDALLASAAQ